MTLLPSQFHLDFAQASWLSIAVPKWESGRESLMHLSGSGITPESGLEAPDVCVITLSQNSFSQSKVVFQGELLHNFGNRRCHYNQNCNFSAFVVEAIGNLNFASSCFIINISSVKTKFS